MLMRHREMLWRMCWNWTGGNRDRCCDLLQEVSIALWENFDKLRPGASASQERSWVRWQARSVFYQIGRQKRLSTVPLCDGGVCGLEAGGSGGGAEGVRRGGGLDAGNEAVMKR